MPEVNILIKATDQASAVISKTAKSSQSMGLKFTELAAKVNLAQQAVLGVIEAGKQLIEFGRAGAELEYASSKFDKLSASIGTTSDALLNDLRKATKGLVSDAELVGSAGDFMALGLAKSHDEVVRLTRVAGALGMDMNQLVLTLTNKTTMRFDALGVSVDGFDEKVKRLKESGMDVNAAFTEAFLQQAEDQIDRVGDKADETAAAFDRFDTAIANVTDKIKKDAAPAIAELADDMATRLTLSLEMSGAEIDKHIRMMDDAAKADEEWASSQREAARAATIAAEETAAATEVNRETIDVTNQQAWAIDAMAESYEGAGRAAALAAQNAEAMAAASSSLADAQTQLANAETSWKEGAGGELASMLENRIGAGDRYKEGLKAIDEVMGTSLVTEQQMKDQQKALIDEFSRTGDVDKFKEGMQALNDTFMPLNESVEKATTLVQTLQEKIDTLTGKTYTVLVRAQVSGDISGAVTAAVTGAGTSVTKTTTTANKHGGEREYADGGSFTIPPGYEDHTWPVGPGRWAQTGEQVTITPKGESAGGITINVNGAGDPGMVAEMVYQKLRSSLRGYGGAYAGG